MKSPCVAYPADEPLVLIRASQVRLCDGNHCAAALLSYFGYWHSIRLEQAQQAEHANKVAALHGETGTQETTLLQYHTEDAIETGLLHLYGRKTIRVAMALLVGKGFLSIHSNPNPRYRFDKTHYFLFHPDVVQAELSVAVHEVKMPDRSGKNAASYFAEEDSGNVEESEHSVHEVKMPHREGAFAASSGKNAAPIAEITSETTEEEKNSLTTFENSERSVPAQTTEEVTTTHKPKRSSKAKTHRHGEHPMPLEETAQAEMHTHIFDANFAKWLERTHPQVDAEAQWEFFVNACLAKDYWYANFRAAFMNSFTWGNSPAQHANSNHRAVTSLSYTEQRRQREAEAAQRFLRGTYERPTGPTGLPDRDDPPLDDVEYRRIDG